MGIIHQYDLISGQQHNLNLGMFFSVNASRNLQMYLSIKTYIGLTDNNIIYLENPCFIQRNKTRNFLMIIDNIVSLRMESKVSL